MKLKVLVTGASGFLGKIIVEHLYPNYSVTLLGRASTNNIAVDLSIEVPSLHKFDYIVHAAGKAHMVPSSKAEGDLFHQVNVGGTENLLQALDNTGSLPESFVFISSVAVYGRRWGKNLNEQEPLMARDPYGSSKILAEQKITKWCKDRGVKLAVLRLPLVVGANPPGNLQKMISAIRRNRWLHVDGGKARRSMVLAEDVANILVAAMDIGGIYNLTDGHHPSFRELHHEISRYYGKSNAFNLPLPLASLAAKIGDLLGPGAPFNSNIFEKLSQDLTFSDQKARENLGWDPQPVTSQIKRLLTLE